MSEWEIFTVKTYLIDQCVLLCYVLFTNTVFNNQVGIYFGMATSDI